MEYFYIENNSQMGPLSVDLLITQIKPETKVWCPGMSDWTRACDVPELALAMGLANEQEQPTQNPMPGYPPNVDFNNQYQGGNSNSSQYQSPNQNINGLGQNVNGGYPMQAGNGNFQGNGNYQNNGNFQGNGYYQNNGYGQNVNNQGKPENYLVLAIISTVLCCWPLGIVSIIKAASVDSAWARGDFDKARKDSEDAKKWAIISMVSAAVIMVLYLIFMGVAATAGM